MRRETVLRASSGKFCAQKVSVVRVPPYENKAFLTNSVILWPNRKFFGHEKWFLTYLIYNVHFGIHCHLFRVLSMVFWCRVSVWNKRALSGHKISSIKAVLVFEILSSNSEVYFLCALVCNIFQPRWFFQTSSTGLSRWSSWRRTGPSDLGFFEAIWHFPCVCAPLEHSLAKVDGLPTLLCPALSPCDQTLFGKISLICLTMILCLYLIRILCHQSPKI